MYSPWEPTATLQSAGVVGSAALGASAPTEGGEGRAHIVSSAKVVTFSTVCVCVCVTVCLLPGLVKN